MSYQISKYEAIKAILDAEESNQDKLAAKLLDVVRRATRKEIQKNTYNAVFYISEKEKKYFEKVYGIFITSAENTID